MLIEDLGADPAQRCKWAYLTPLQYAATLGCTEVVKVLAQHGGDVDATAPELGGGTALHLAAASLSVPTVAALIEAGADRSAIDAAGRTPLACAESALANRDQDPLFDEDASREIINLLRFTAGDRDLHSPGSRAKVPPETVGAWQDANETLFDGRPLKILGDGTVEFAGDGHGRGTARQTPAGALEIEAGGESTAFDVIDGELVEQPRSGHAQARLVRVGGVDAPINSVGTWKDANGRKFGGLPIHILGDGTVEVVGGGSSENGTASEPPGEGVLHLSVAGESGTFRMVEGKLLERPPRGSSINLGHMPACLVRVSDAALPFDAVGAWKDANSALFEGRPLRIMADGTVEVGGGDRGTARATHGGAVLLEAGGEKASFDFVDGELVEDQASARSSDRRQARLVRIGGIDAPINAAGTWRDANGDLFGGRLVRILPNGAVEVVGGSGGRGTAREPPVRFEFPFSTRFVYKCVLLPCRASV